MSKKDIQRLYDYLEHIVEAIERIHSYVEDETEIVFLENIKKNNYINIIVIRADEQHDSSLLLLKQAINSNKTKQFINNKYKGAIIPAF